MPKERKCHCQDSTGAVCGKYLSKKEFEQDGMCSVCADEVWAEMSTKEEYFWRHHEEE